MAGEENHLEIIKLSSFKKSGNLVGKPLEGHKLKNVLMTVGNLSTDKRALWRKGTRVGDPGTEGPN